MRPGLGAAPATALLALLLVLPSCASMGSVIGGGRPDDLYGEVRSVDSRRGYLQLRVDYGRDYTVRYDGRTRVVYGSRDYSVSSLRRGDPVRVRVEYDRYNEPWAERIELRRDVRLERARDDRVIRARTERWDGVVRDVDVRRGWFVLDRNRGSDARVHVNRATRRDDIRRFERLRRGQRVDVEVRTSIWGQADLIRFR
jgi:hypothetical protein